MDYTIEWRKTDSLEELGLYRKALGKVEEIYKTAKTDHNSGEELKALIFKLRYIHILSENGYTGIIRELEGEREDNRVVFKAVKSSMLAELYYRYYQQNRWLIFKNTTYNPADTSHPETWSPSQFGDYIDRLYQESLMEAEILCSVSLDDFKPVLRDSLPENNSLYVFDLLARRALDFYKNDEMDYSQNPLPDLLLDSGLFSPGEEFLPWVEKLGDGASFIGKSLKIYSQLIANHQENSEEPELIAIELDRFKYCHEIYLPDNGDELFLAALGALFSRTEVDSLQADVLLEKARFYQQRSGRYKIIGKDNDKYRKDRGLAFVWAKNSLGNSPGKRTAIEAQNLINRIVAPKLKSTSETFSIPNRSIPLSVEYANLDAIWYWITPVDPKNAVNIGYREGKKGRDVFIEGNSPVASGKFNIPNPGDYNLHRVSLELPPLIPGNYQLLISGSPDPDNTDDFISTGFLRVSNISWLSQRREEGKLIINVVDRSSGNPIEGIEIKQYFRHYNTRTREENLKAGSKYISDNNGQIIIEAARASDRSYRSESFHLLFGSEKFGVMSQERFYLNPRFSKNNSRISQRVYTDRGIYRPGQEVLFTGILVLEDKHSIKAEQNHKLKVSMQDSKYKNIESLETITDENGFFSGSFSIPSDALSGRFQLMTKYGRQTILVEQYKRPGFNITMDKDTRVYLPGDSIYCEGQAEAFAGVELSGASVEVDIYLNLNSFHSYRHRFSGRKILVDRKSGELDNNGRFSWSVQSIGFLGSKFSRATYEFNIKIKDKNGETRELLHHIIIGTKSLSALIAGPSKLNRRDKGEWKISTKSPGGREVEAEVLVRIGRLNETDRRYLPSPLPEPDTWVYSEKQWERIFPRIPYKKNTEEDSLSRILYSEIHEIDIKGYRLGPDLSGWGPGRYRILISRPDTPEDIVGEYEFDLFNSNRKAFPVRDPVWLTTEHSDYEPGQKMEFFLGARYPGLYQVEISGKDTIFYKDWILLDNRLNKRSLLISNDMLGNISIQVNGVYENNHFSSSQLIPVPWKNKELRVIGLDNLETYEPGETVDLALKIIDQKGDPVSTQGVLTVYDLSLDEISPLYWSDFNWPLINRGIPWNSGAFGLSTTSLKQSPITHFNQVPAVPEIGLNWFSLGYYGGRAFNSREMAMQPAARQMKNVEVGEGLEMDEMSLSADDQQNTESPQELQPESTEQSMPPYFRKDFRETACFVSAFETDDNGEGSVHFTMPDAITKWKVKLYGHDQEMAQVLAESEFQSQKNLMLLPNFPRFVRVGDRVELAVKIAYKGAEKVSATSRLQIANDINPDSFFIDLGQELELLPHDQKTVTWSFEVPEDPHYIKINLSASSGSSTDGITVDIPVLPKRLNFWESKSFLLRDPAVFTLTTGEKAEKAVLELNTQPIWLAVQSLPVFSEEGLPCSELWFTRYFTSRIIEKISSDNPKVKERLNKLSQEMESDPRLNSFLKNEEMRRFILESGLWEGADEEEAAHLKALAESFMPDFNRKEISRSLNELSKLQLSDGSWPWFRGMRPDFRMTLHILGGLGELSLLHSGTEKMDPQVQQMISRGIISIDRYMHDRYSRQRLANPKSDPGLSGDIIYYLYVRSFFSETQMDDKYKEAYSYYFEKSGREWLDWSITDQVFIAMSHHRNGDKKVPGLVMNSLLDRKLESQGGGIFWKINPGFRGWNNRDIWQQSRIIEFFSSMDQGEEYLDGMRTWMIQQKRSRDWGDRISTSMAVKSLILYGSNWYQTQSKISVNSGNEEFSPLRIDLGTDVSGHYRYTWNESEIDEDGLDLRFKKEDKLPVWGALFINKTMDLDTLEAAGTDLKITRTLLMETLNNGKINWIPVDEVKVKAGTRIKVRLEVMANQAIDYVQLRDYRPASFEPDKSLSGYNWASGVSWYQTNNDQFTDFFISHLPKGYSFFEFGLYAEQAGAYSKGYAEIQSQYAPEFMARSKGGRIGVVKD